MFDPKVKNARDLKVEITSKLITSYSTYWPIVFVAIPILSGALTALNVPLPLFKVAQIIFKMLVWSLNGTVAMRYIDYFLDGFWAIMSGDFNVSFNFNII